MSKTDEIKKIADLRNGIIKTSDMVAEGVSKPTLANFIAEHGYEYISRGIYCLPDSWVDGICKRFSCKSSVKQLLGGVVVMIQTARQLKDLIRNLSANAEVESIILKATLHFSKNEKLRKLKGIEVLTKKRK